MLIDRVQTQRFEQKYLIEEATAVQVREFVRSYLELDEFGEGKPNCSYPVHSLYLDSADLRLAQDTINGNKNRFKLRIRYYDEHPETPVFFEIKRRVNNCIRKQRGGVRKEAVPGLLAGQLPGPGQMFSKDPKHWVALQQFLGLMEGIRGVPQAHISYFREAYIDRAHNAVRVTMDRAVAAVRQPRLVFSTETGGGVRPFGALVILELKFTDRFPRWFGELVRTFSCMQCGAAKYVEGIDMMGGLDPARVFSGEESSPWLPGRIHRSRGLRTPESEVFAPELVDHPL